MAVITIKGHEVLIDDEDLHLCTRYKWNIAKSGKSGHIYLVRYRNKVAILLHRELMSAPKELEVDHRNGNGLDNRRANLRLCTHGENMMNRRIHRNNKSGIKGVSWVIQYSKWMASIQINGKTKHLGKFSNKEDAAMAYEKAAIELFGDFARQS